MELANWKEGMQLYRQSGYGDMLVEAQVIKKYHLEGDIIVEPDAFLPYRSSIADWWPSEKEAKLHYLEEKRKEHLARFEIATFNEQCRLLGLPELEIT